MGGSQVDVVPGDNNSGYIKLKCRGEETIEIHFRVKMTTPLAKLTKTYSDRLGRPSSSLQFTFDGRQFVDTDTPGQLGMRNDDVIQVIIK